MRSAVAIAVLVLLLSLAVAAQPLTDYVLQAHGAVARFASTSLSTAWSGSTANMSWIPIPNSTCGQSGALLITPEAVLIPLVCESTNSSVSSSVLLALNVTTGEPVAIGNFTALQLAMLPLANGLIVASAAISNASLGVMALNSQLLPEWTTSLCGPAICGRVTVIAVAATADIIATVAIGLKASFIDIPYPTEPHTALPQGQLTEGMLDAAGKGLFVYNTSSLEGFWRVHLPLSDEPIDRVWFAYPPHNASLIPFSPLTFSDISGNVYAGIGNQPTSETYEAVLISYSANGMVRWETHIPLPSTPTQFGEPVLTDDESLWIVPLTIIFPRGWWLAAISTHTGQQVWNVSKQPWHDLTDCGTPVPLANNTLILKCMQKKDAGAYVLVAFDQRTGTAFPGRVNLPKNLYTTIAYDSASNAYVCSAENSIGPTTCAKFPLGECLYSANSCKIPL